MTQEYLQRSRLQLKPWEMHCADRSGDRPDEGEHQQQKGTRACLAQGPRRSQSATGCKEKKANSCLASATTIRLRRSLANDGNTAP